VTALEFPRFRGNALCAEADPDAFFPDKGGPNRAVKKMCADCEVRVPRLEWSFDNREPFGVWAGITETQRARMLRDGRRAS
jgi:WhiB family redox-sensing transcriptional regulator